MPIITISRLFGSGGSEVAERVSRALGWSLLDNAFVDAVADRLGVSPEEVTLREERTPSLAERLASALTLGAPETLPPPEATLAGPSDDRLVEVTRRVVEEAVARGPVVVVGRGAQAMLAERGDVLHVFCYAPKSALVARAARRLGLSTVETERIVDETNRQRELYVKRNWKRNWQALENYHLCVNTEGLGIDGAALAIVQLARERFGS